MSNEDMNKVEELEEVASSFNLKKEVFEWFYTIIIALIIAFVIKGFLFDFVVVDGSSMYPALVNGERLIITKLGYEPKQQDIIVLDSTYKKRNAYYSELGDLNFIEKGVEYFKLPSALKRKYYVKRVIALPSQVVDIIDNKVYVDGEPLEEDYYDGLTYAYDSAVSFPFTVSEDHIFVMGDNRSVSQDSRSSALGEVPIDAVAGKCTLRIWPLNSIGIIKH